jgi:hypothetical protein
MIPKAMDRENQNTSFLKTKKNMNINVHICTNINEIIPLEHNQIKKKQYIHKKDEICEPERTEELILSCLFAVVVNIRLKT